MAQRSIPGALGQVTLTPPGVPDPQCDKATKIKTAETRSERKQGREKMGGIRNQASQNN